MRSPNGNGCAYRTNQDRAGSIRIQVPRDGRSAPNDPDVVLGIADKASDHVRRVVLQVRDARVEMAHVSRIAVVNGHSLVVVRTPVSETVYNVGQCPRHNGWAVILAFGDLEIVFVGEVAEMPRALVIADPCLR